jgi:ATP-dependent RNA helicase RhlE
MNKAILTPLIQEQSIPLVLAGDLIGCAQTGTGKQQHLPIIHQLHRIVGSSKKSQANSCISSS